MFFSFLNSQEISNWKSSSIVVDKKLKFEVSIEDKIYGPNDTISVKYDIENLLENNVAIIDFKKYGFDFNVISNYKEEKDDSCGFYMLWHGGCLYYNIGYESNFHFTRLKPKSSKNYFIKFIIADSLSLNECYDYDRKSVTGNQLISKGIAFYIGFLILNHGAEFKFNDNKSKSFNGDDRKVGTWINANYQEKILGPVWFDFQDNTK